MTSAFFPPTQSPPCPLPGLTDWNENGQNDGTYHAPRKALPAESETEDEEVKFNCLRGLSGSVDDSDMNTVSNSDSDDDDDDDDDEESTAAHDRQVGVVRFVSRLLRPSPRIVRPAFSRHGPLSPSFEDDQEDTGSDIDDEDGEEEEEAAASEVGARGVALPFETEDEGYDTNRSSEDDSDMEGDDERSVSGSEASTSDDEEMDDEEDDEEADETDEPRCEEAPEPLAHELVLERPVLKEDFALEDPEDSASVVLRVLEEEDDADDEEISSLIDASSSSLGEPVLMEEDEAALNAVVTIPYSSLRLIGVAKDREKEWATVPRVKRTLSLDEALRSERDAVSPISLPPKRRRSDANHDSTNELLSFSLGPPAFTTTTLEATPGPDVRMLSPFITSSESQEEEAEDLDDDLEQELDGQLRYELESAASSSGDQSPVPLLTPPQSPVVVNICEWPSNLAIDSALTSMMTQVRPLDTWVGDQGREPEVIPEKSALAASSHLTPLIRGIQVALP